MPLYLPLEMIFASKPVHAYAAKSGKYTSLSHAAIEKIFKFWLEIPLALGTVGGLTSSISEIIARMLEKPSAQELMQFVAVAGLA
jgi:hydroxymethylglutaryl-CoA reductase